MWLELTSTILFTASAALAVPTAIYATESFAGVLPRRSCDKPPKPRRPSIAVIVPAHDEERGILRTLRRIRPQMSSADRLVVVADNCTDSTAALAREAGAEVVERNDRSRIGKGYALDAGIRYLSNAPCAYVMIVDADCDLDEGALDSLCTLAAATGRPVQGRNLMKAPPGATLDTRVAEFAYLVKNMVRPTGMARLGWPCQLMGTGMLIPWEAMLNVDLAHGHVTEDMKLSIDLAQRSYAPTFCPDHGIISYFPLSRAGTDSQRRRWEGGHVRMIGCALKLFLKPSSIRTWSARVLLLDQLVPPLTLLFLALAGLAVMTTAITSLGGSIAPIVLAGGNLMLFSATTIVVWFFRGREILPLGATRSVPVFVLKKARAYSGFGWRSRHGGWVRTDRGDSG